MGQGQRDPGKGGRELPGLRFLNFSDLIFEKKGKNEREREKEEFSFFQNYFFVLHESSRCRERERVVFLILHL